MTLRWSAFVRVRFMRAKRSFLNCLLEQFGRPCTRWEVAHSVALRTPNQLCRCLGPAKTEARATARALGF